METAVINGKRENLTYRTNSEMYTRYTHPNLKSGQYGAEVYTPEKSGDTHRVIVACSGQNGSCLTGTTTVITVEEYEKITDLYDPYNAFSYHDALMTLMGFE